MQREAAEEVPAEQAREPDVVGGAPDLRQHDGRGQQLGGTLVQLNQLLEGTNPSLPDLQANLRALSPTADIYNQASPDLLAALDNLVTTSQTLVQQRAAFESTFRSVTSASNVTTDFLAANRANIIDLAATSRPTLCGSGER